MAEAGADVLIGIDAGTTTVKAVAFDLGGRQLGVASRPNRYASGEGGAVVQPMERTWEDCARVLVALGDEVDGLARRTAAVAVTAQGDGTWLVGGADRPVGDAWLWLDSRAAGTVRRLAGATSERARFETTGTGLNACQQGPQLAHMAATAPEPLERAEVALHCKDWLYLKLTGVRATDPSEACFSFGDFRTRAYDASVIEALGLTRHTALLPPIVDGTRTTHPLTAEAARACGLAPGTPVSLGYVDMVSTALGAGVYTGDVGAACSVIGSTGVHMRAVTATEARPNAEGTGYTMTLPIPDRVVQMQSNMAAALNIDWMLSLAGDLLESMGLTVSPADRVAMIERWMAASRPGTLLYQPYISSAGERGPFVDPHARAGFVGLSSAHRFPDMLRSVIEGLGLAMRDCYEAMGELPAELRLSGGAVRSPALRAVLGASLGASVRVGAREEAGAAGAAMTAAVAIGAYPDMDACIAEWVTPLLGAAEAPDAELATIYERTFRAHATARRALAPVWQLMGERPAESNRE